jgi:leader peptidase (prepilin peptidase)/N-methyltransferase
MPSGPWLLALEAKPLWGAFAFLMGLVVGSFANVCIHRLPLGGSVVKPRSRCPGCGAPISALDNVPLLSYLLLRGRCRSCRAPISIRYPAVEAANGLMYAGVALLKGPTPDAILSMCFLTALLVLALIDFDHHILPNVITLPGIACGILTSWLTAIPTPLGSWLSLRIALRPETLESAAAAALGYAAVAAITGLAWSYYKVVKKEDVEPMGQGDWKLMAMLGAFRGSRGMWLAGFLGTFLGAVVGVGLVAAGKAGRRTPLPLGTFLCAGAALELFAGAELLSWYRRLFPHI